MSRLALACAGLVVLAPLLGCHATVSTDRAPARRLTPGPIRRPAALDHEFQWRQKVTAIHGNRRFHFDAVLQHHEGVVRLVGLSPLGKPGFVITLSAEGTVTLESHRAVQLPFEPHYIMADVQRVFFPWLDEPPPFFSGRRTGRLQGLEIAEVYSAGVLQKRSFTRDDAPERGTVSVQYVPGHRKGTAPTRVVVDNRWFDYRLVIETVAQSRL